MIRISVLILLVCMWSVAISATKAQPSGSPSDSAQTTREIQALQYDLAALRRDQLNYKIEKDLLKEAYSSNLQSINIIVTIAFGIFAVIGTILGVVGIRTINQIKGDHRRELEDLRALRTTVESEIKSVMDRVEKINAQVGDVAKTNEEQERRLRLLEVTEKATHHFNQRRYDTALEYADIGLSIEPESIELLGVKGLCEGRQGDLVAAVKTHELAYSLSPENMFVIPSLAEYYLLSGDLAAFDDLMETHREEMNETIPENIPERALSIYLEALRAIMAKDMERVREVMLPYLSSVTNQGAVSRIGTWSFEEASGVIHELPAGELRELASQVLSFFAGTLNREGMQAALVSGQSVAPH